MSPLPSLLYLVAESPSLAGPFASSLRASRAGIRESSLAFVFLPAAGAGVALFGIFALVRWGRESYAEAWVNGSSLLWSLWEWVEL